MPSIWLGISPLNRFLWIYINSRDSKDRHRYYCVLDCLIGGRGVSYLLSPSPPVPPASDNCTLFPNSCKTVWFVWVHTHYTFTCSNVLWLFPTVKRALEENMEYPVRMYANTTKDSSSKWSAAERILIQQCVIKWRGGTLYQKWKTYTRYEVENGYFERF